MRMFVVSMIVLGALAFGLYQCKPVRTHVRNVLMGPADREADPLTAAAQPQQEQQAGRAGSKDAAPEGNTQP